MATTTTRLGLTKPATTDLVDISVLNTNFDKTDAAAGSTVCTSGTRPSTPYSGQVIYETDTKLSYVWNSSTSAWVILMPGAIVCTSSTRPSSPVTGTVIYETNTQLTYVYTGAAWSLAAQNRIFASSSARSTAIASPIEGLSSYLSDSNSLELYDGSAWKRVVNTTGSVLQVVTGTYSTTAGNNTTTYADTGLTASITPYSTSSKILVFVHQAGVGKSAANSGSSVNLRLVRGSTEITAHGGISFTGTAVQLIVGSASIIYLDSPATTASTTYKTQFSNGVAAASAVVQNNSGFANVSTITLLEIAA